MSFLNLRLPPAKKGWKSFTFKLQSKLRKLCYRKSKAIKKKPKNCLHSTSSSAKALINPSPFRDQRKKHRLRAAACLFKKKATAPVYIDRLFKDLTPDELVVKDPPSIKNVKMILGQETRAPGTSYKKEKTGGSVADDMWESLALASPQMNGIDQRAEEFIIRFRAEMKLQEMIARRNF